MGALMRTVDWASTPVGPVDGWPQSLRTALGILLLTRHPTFIWWGPELVQFYNDGYRPILGATKHPAAMGGRGRETWAEIWPVIEPMIAKVFAGGATYEKDGLLVLDRNGFLEECYFDYAYSPIRDESGGVGGVYVACSETTGRVLGERRLQVLGAVGSGAAGATTVEEAARAALASLAAEAAADVPFAAIYLPRGRALVRVAASGFPAGPVPLPSTLGLECGPADRWPVARVFRERRRLRVELPQGGAALPGGPWPEPAKVARMLPLVHGGRTLGVLVTGLSPRLPYGKQYRNFLELLADHVGRVLSGAEALEEERRRAAALSALDRAKTTFFSNVSHELRTPLTLMLGPTEDALAAPERALAGERLEAVHRNQLRLLKLVNSLLDFARIEAGRVEPVREPTDLAALTRELADAFRPAVERAGLALEVDVPDRLDAAVDREMFEKIALNLLSNALKYTFAGGVSIALRSAGGRVELRVRDTGVGIPAAEQARIFERFHRVEGVRARTAEGSGIGLALVAELTRLQGGAVSVESTPGAGSLFTVSLPAARAPARVPAAERRRRARITAATHFVQEALGWIADPADLPVPAPEISPLQGPERVLVVEDNADMRAYLRSILAPHWRVEAVAEGARALDAARARPPDLVLTDVMMPGLDGFALLRALRADARTRAVPVVMLSARAGEEVRVEGLEAGADDYVVKPFGARELVARIRAQLALARARAALDEQRVALYELFQHAPLPICVFRGPELVFEMVNPVYRRLVGGEGRELAGRPMLEALPELRETPFAGILREVLRTGKAYSGTEQRIPLARGPGGEVEDTWWTFLYAPFTAGAGRADRIVAVASDVTEQVRARRALEAASHAKDSFLAMLGHELRNPLAPMGTALQLMRLREPDRLVRERTVLERQVEHMGRLVEDLLDVSRIAQGKVQLRREVLELDEVVDRALEVASPLLEERRHHVDVDVPPGIRLHADPDRLGQILSNLLTNAAKYTDPGGRITVRGSAGGGQAIVEVQDDGRGIAPELLPRVFELFVQGARTPERQEGGLGLGLSIVKSLTELHGGQVEVRSAGQGAGSTFTVRLPLLRDERAAAAPTASPARGAPPVRRRILVVDDNRDGADTLAEFLENLGHETVCAYDGPEALRVADRFRPEIVLLDLGLPVMDGFEVARRLRESGAPPKLIAITGYGQHSDRARTQEAGFDLHLVKPIDVSSLPGVL
jgi:PAS domain S-box-containing protein